jgi:hypothetical protein
VKALQGGIPLEELNNGVRHGQNDATSSSSTDGYTAQMERIRRAAMVSPGFGHASPASSADSIDQEERRRRA